VKTTIQQLPSDMTATSIVIHLRGGHTQITGWDYALEQRDQTIYINNEPVMSVQIAPPLVLLYTGNHAVVVHEPYVRQRAQVVGIALP
jgi:hypothetical protein